MGDKRSRSFVGLTIWVPYTYRHQPTLDALNALPNRHFEVDVSANHWEYPLFLREKWRAGVDWINCEHDVIPLPAQIDHLERCPNGWCAVRDPLCSTPTFSLARFRAPFMAAHPDVWDRLLAQDRVTIFQPLWQICDVWLRQQCGEPCLHAEPAVINTRPLGALH